MGAPEPGSPKFRLSERAQVLIDGGHRNTFSYFQVVLLAGFLHLIYIYYHLNL